MQIEEINSQSINIFNYSDPIKTIYRAPKKYTRVRKNARYSKTGHVSATQIGLSFQISFSTPENTKTFKDLIKIDQVRAKTVKTRFVRGST